MPSNLQDLDHGSSWRPRPSRLVRRRRRRGMTGVHRLAFPTGDTLLAKRDPRGAGLGPAFARTGTPGPPMRHAGSTRLSSAGRSALTYSATRRPQARAKLADDGVVRRDCWRQAVHRSRRSQEPSSLSRPDPLRQKHARVPQLVPRRREVRPHPARPASPPSGPC